MARAGHADLKVSQHYVNTAAVIRRGYGAPFPSLPSSALGSDQTRTKAPRISRRAEKTRGSAWVSNEPLPDHPRARTHNLQKTTGRACGAGRQKPPLSVVWTKLGPTSPWGFEPPLLSL
jgi:hypothetical protein